MKLNNKGMTLVELIVSIALISIVISFLFKVILDVKYEKDNQGFASGNQINRAEIIKTIQEDFLNLGVKKMPGSTDDVDYIVTYSNGKYGFIRIINNNKTLEYIYSGKSHKWTIEDKGYTYGNIQVELIGDSYAKVTIPIVSSLSDQTIDDIELLAKIS